MMMCLGQFVFGMNTAAYQEFKRQTQWKHPSTSRVGAANARQFTGKGEDTITLSGWFAPEFNGSTQALNILRAMGDTGRPYVLVEGTGKIYGPWIITGVSEGRKHLKEDGSGRRIEFSITLSSAAVSLNAAIGAAADTISKYLPTGLTLPDIPKIPDIADILR